MPLTFYCNHYLIAVAGCYLKLRRLPASFGWTALNVKVLRITCTTVNLMAGVSMIVRKTKQSE